MEKRRLILEIEESLIQEVEKMAATNSLKIEEQVIQILSQSLKSAPDNCIIPGCDSPTRARGLCIRHYHQAFKRVKEGLKSWEELEAKGLALAPGKPGPKSDSVFDD